MYLKETRTLHLDVHVGQYVRVFQYWIECVNVEVHRLCLDLAMISTLLLGRSQWMMTLECLILSRKAISY